MATKVRFSSGEWVEVTDDYQTTASKFENALAAGTPLRLEARSGKEIAINPAHVESIRPD
jgi:hypothetical protein